MRISGLAIILEMFMTMMSWSQEIYVVTGNNDLYRLNLDDCSIQFVVKVQQQTYDISFDPHGNLYGVSSSGNLFQIDTLTGQTTFLHKFNGQSFNSLTIGADGTIYTTGNAGNLWSYSLNTGIAVFIGNYGFSATGDLTFYHGELYVAVTSDRIVKINLLQPNQSKVIINDDIPGNILGIVSNFVNCNQINCYAITNGLSDVYLIDFEHNKFQLVCQLNITVGGGASKSEFLNSSPLRIDTLVGGNANCKNEGGSITIQASGGTGPLEYSINGDPFVSDTAFTNLMANLYTVIIRDEKGCMDTSMITLAEATSPVVDTILTTPCQCNQGNGSLIIQASGGTGELRYSIDSIFFQADGRFKNLAPQSYSLWVMDAAGCFAKGQASIDSLGGAAILSAEIGNTSCGQQNGWITIATDSIFGTSYSLDGLNFQNENNFVALAAQAYHLTIVDKNGCMDTLTVEIAPSTTPALRILSTLPETCERKDGSVIVQGTGGISPYQFSLDGNTFQEADTFSHLSKGRYTLYIIDQAACLDSNYAEINAKAGLNIIDVVTQPTACSEPSGSIEINVSGGTAPFEYTIDNHPAQFVPSFEQLGFGDYFIQVSDASGCLADTLVKITRTGCPLYIPNVFSPNGDGVNDIFRPETVESQQVRITRMLIFDRWGNNVFSANNLDIHSDEGWWDGKFKRFTLNPGVFAYYIEAEFESGEKQTFKGDITLLR